MSTSDNLNVHPFFDPRGFYRLVLETRWRDQPDWHPPGAASISEFFKSLEREELREQWQVEVPDQTQNWGFGKALDRNIGRYLSNNYERSQRTETAVVPVRGGESLRPRMILFDLQGDLDELPKLWREWEIPCSESGCSLVVEKRHFTVMIGDLPVNRRCMVIVIPPHLLTRISLVFGYSRVPRPEELLARVVSARLHHGDRASVEFRTAMRIVGLLTLAPAFECETGCGSINVRIPLIGAGSALPSYLRIIVALGPTGT